MPPVDQVRAALDELRSLRCNDPAARRAAEVLRLTAHTLEFFWLPTLSERSAADPGTR